MHVSKVLHAARWKYRTPKIRHMGTIAQLCRPVSSQLRHVSTIGGKLVKQHLLHMFRQYGELRPITGWDLLAHLGHPANFCVFCVLASILQRHRATEAIQTLHDVWPSPGLVHYTFSAALAPWRNLPGTKFTLRPSFAFSYIDSVTARHSSNGLQPKFAPLRGGRHLFSAGWPSRWASAHFQLTFILRFIGLCPTLL